MLAAVFIAVTLGLALFCTLAAASPVPIVRIMVDREKQSMRVDGFDLLVHESVTNRKLAHESKRAWLQIQCSLGGRMEVRTSAGDRMRAAGPLHVTSLGGFIRVGSSQYRDDLYIYSFNGDCIAVNHVDLEKYIAGLLNSEMSAKWSMQALMAQAIAARTYAIYQMKESSTAHYRGLKPPFDLDSSVKDQVYEGANMERYKAIQAVQQTHGQVLTFDGKPIKAFYHSTCGGHTETPDRVWGMRLPYLRSVQCDFCQKSPRYNWAYSIHEGDIERKLRAEGLLRGRLLGMRVVDRNNLGRANRVEIHGSEATIVVAATRVRDIMGTVNVRSTDFSIARNPEGGANGGNFVFVGHGSGHGVGMCQWGAKTMGERGRRYTDILSYYYPAAQITKLY
ncbi:MAG: SpoIID/LytB domain-containing protein [Deltaproteobacteria bacterium]|nr:SpoIID/LytB domain-containing protein [Deltaproteobacteria bacterium]